MLASHEPLDSRLVRIVDLISRGEADAATKAVFELQAELERKRAAHVSPPALDTVAQAALAGIDLARRESPLVDVAAVRQVAEQLRALCCPGDHQGIVRVADGFTGTLGQGCFCSMAAELRRALGGE